MPCEVVDCWVSLTAAGQSQRSASVHHTGGTSQNRGVLRRIWREREGKRDMEWIYVYVDCTNDNDSESEKKGKVKVRRDC